jgi:hypothetical protein
VSVRVGQITDLVDHKQRRTGVMAQPAPQSGIAVQRAEIAEQLARAGEQNIEPLERRLMGDVLRDRRFTDTVWPNQHDVGGVLEELQRHQRIDDGPITAFGP